MMLLAAREGVLLVFFVALCCRNNNSDAFAPSSPPPQQQRRRQTELKSSASFHEVHWLANDGIGDDANEYQDNYLYDDLYDNLYDDDDDQGGGDKPLGEAIAKGEAVICIPDIASPEECQYLFNHALSACENSNRGEVARGRNRFSVSDPTAFSNDVVLSCDEILSRALDYIDSNIPSIYTTLFRSATGSDWLNWQPLNAMLEEPQVPPSEHLLETCDGVRDLYMMGELEWSEGEPAM